MVRKLIIGAAAAVAIAAPTIIHADIAFIAILRVPEANQAEFDVLAGRMVEAASENSGLLIYEFARSGEVVYGYERYVDETAHARHEEIIGPFLDELAMLATFETIVTLSKLSAQHRRAFEAMGAEVGEPIASFAKGVVDRSHAMKTGE